MRTSTLLKFVAVALFLVTVSAANAFPVLLNPPR
jgi:hypothetical protein